MNQPLLLDQAAMKLCDDAALALSGNSETGFINRAGGIARDWVCARFPDSSNSRITILAGSGNNGADALALGRLLGQHGFPVEIFHVPGRSGRTSSGWQEQAVLLKAAGMPLRHWPSGSAGALEAVAEAIAASALAVDGICGLGMHGPLSDASAEAVSVLNAKTAVPVLALDLPSGLHDGWLPEQAAVRAEATICFAHAKSCLYRPAQRPLAGHIIVADIGFPTTLPDGVIASNTPSLLQLSDLAGLSPRFSPDCHKFERGSLGILAGSRAYPGAAMLCAQAAANSRAGLVRLLLDPELADIIRPQAAELLIHALGPGLIPESALPARLDALVVGPGWDRSAERQEKLGSLFALADQRKLPMVLDADALHALAQLPLDSGGLALAHGGLILTPHLGEMAALSGESAATISLDPLPILRRLAARFRAVMVLKGAVSWIVAPDGRVQVYDGANPVLAQAGSGDVLAGIMGAVLAGLTRAGLSAETACMQAAQVAVLALSAAGLKMSGEIGWGSSRALISSLPGVWSDCQPPGFRTTELWRKPS